MADLRIFVSIHDMEHVKLHVYEMERLIEDMRETHNPLLERTQRLLDRFVKTDIKQDRV